MQQALLEIAKLVKVHNGAGAGTSAQNGTAVDMTGFDAVAFVADLGTVTDNSVLTLTAQQGAVSDGSDAAAFSPAIATAPVTASGSSNSLLATDVMRPTKRYVRPVLTRTAQNAVLNTMIAILYKAKKTPITTDASLLAQVVALGS